jgi:Trk-type K+ transport system membrane component
MFWKSRPVPVLVVALLFLAVGGVGFVYHFRELSAPDGIWIELTEFLAFVSGVFLLLGQNWARWLAIAWMAFHVVLSAFGSFRETAIHAVFLAVIAWLLFRPDSSRFFSGANT